jgi:hypothetical protein
MFLDFLTRSLQDFLNKREEKRNENTEYRPLDLQFIGRSAYPTEYIIFLDILILVKIAPV